MAHRGDHRHTTENTMEAFSAAIGLGYRYIESDCQVSADGVAVMAHDPDLKRIAGRPEYIASLTWRQLQGVELTAGGTLARLDEALASFPEIHFNLDAKVPDVIEPMSRTLSQHQERVCIGSFSGRTVRQLRSRLPQAAHSASPREVLDLWLRRRSRFEAHAAMIPTKVGPLKVATSALIDRAHDMGRQVHIWTVDDPEEMNRLLDLGVDGLMTDRPEVLKEVMASRGVW